MSRPVHGGNLVWAARLARCAPTELIDFSASISPLGPPRSVCEAIQAAFSLIGAYPDTAYGELRQALAQHHQVSAEAILPGNGAAELLTWAARDLAALPAGCFCLSPGFSDYDRALQAFGCQPIKIPLLRDQPLDLAAFEAELSDLTRCGLLLNNPHNPTGMMLGRAEVKPLLSRFGLVVVDEAFMDFVAPADEQSVIDWVGEFPNLVVIRSLTKFYSMPGVRLGYAIAQPATLQRWQQWRDPWSVNVLAAAAGVAAIQDTDFQQQTWNWLAKANAQLYEGLNKIPGLKALPSCANFLLVACEMSATALQCQLLQRHKIYIRDCMSFAELGDRYFRVAVKTITDNQRLLAVIADVLPSLESVETGSEHAD
ncbi:MAG: threonine-phosphate decarboxylase CobD [Phormidesmis sp.]